MEVTASQGRSAARLANAGTGNLTRVMNIVGIKPLLAAVGA
jgi:hypothetical protein